MKEKFKICIILANTDKQYYQFFMFILYIVYYAKHTTLYLFLCVRLEYECKDKREDNSGSDSTCGSC